jgi:hypothetical protein
VIVIVSFVSNSEQYLIQVSIRSYTRMLVWELRCDDEWRSR